MSIIKILDEKLRNQIAAGEVVERPASVVKELLENSIDAKATKIVIEVKDSGKTFVKINDNGSGIPADELELALQRHATSKIFSESDLWKIMTMGFRGEALASIASVSKLTLHSRQSHQMAGKTIFSQGGEIISIREKGMPVGTMVEVHNLFFNTPARQKFLKQEATESAHISLIIQTIALAHPGIAIKYLHNGREVLNLPRVNDQISRICDVFGRNFGDALLPISYDSENLKVSGFIGKPLLARSSTKHQYFFVNGRPIQHFLMANALKRAYHSTLMENKKPIFFLNLKIDPAMIDVNVHPRKMEIRFMEEKNLISAIYQAAKYVLDKNELMPKGFTESQRYMSDKLPEKSFAGRQFADISRAKSDKREINESLFFSQNMIGGQREHNPDLVDDSRPKMNVICQIANCYIVAKNEEGLVLIDQHAAHERVRYEELMAQFENQKKQIQPLLTPYNLELTNDEIEVLRENQEIFEKLGFEIENFGGNTYAVAAVPDFFVKESIEEVVRGVLDDISEGKEASKFQGKIEEILTYMSCRGAIKFGQKLAWSEMEELLAQMERLERPYTCPHGRPTMVKLSLDELAKMFGRK